MDAKSVSIDWAVALPILCSAIAPTIVGFLQQFSKKFSDTAPWWAKSIVTAGMAALIGVVTSYAAQGDAMLGATTGVVVGAIGSMNIALRKGTRKNLELIVNQEIDARVDTKVTEALKG